MVAVCLRGSPSVAAAYPSRCTNRMDEVAKVEGMAPAPCSKPCSKGGWLKVEPCSRGGWLK
eukprot:4653174-Amphidinium_carterae.1